MSEPEDITLAWPPRPEELRRLYVDEHLSAMKIARRYGLKYPSPKTAESTILYQLKRAGIERRDCAEHVRKVTEEMVDEWVRRYQAGESLKQIAGDAVDPVSVFNHLKKRGLTLRDKVEAQIKAVTKYSRSKFSADRHDMAYLAGFARGDLFVTHHGLAVRVKTSTTHPRMAMLFNDLFARYGHVREYPRRAQLTGFEWSLECDLDPSMAFLNDEAILKKAIEDKDTFMDFLSGFFDAEGSVFFHKKSAHGNFGLSISNKDNELLGSLATKLQELGFSPKLRESRQSPNRGVKNGSSTTWRLHLWRWDELQRILQCMKLRHSEKVEKSRIALRLAFRADQSERDAIVVEWNSFRDLVAQECEHYMKKAEFELNDKREIELNDSD